MVVFDPHNDGFYLAVGDSYAACQNVYHVHDDFSRAPDLFMPAVPMNPVVREAARIKNLLLSEEEKLLAYIDLAQKYNKDANAQFTVAYHSFLQSGWELFADYAQRAYSMQPFVREYQLFAGIAAYQQKERERAIELLQDIESSDLHPWQEIYRLIVLEKAWAAINPQKSAQYRAQRQALLEKYDAQEYYEKEIAPLF